MTKTKKRILILSAVILVLAVMIAVYLSDYSKADATALAALESSGTVEVTETDYGWFFDGPGTDAALVFYPGAKVEATAYAPLLRLLAENGTDVCLAEVPARMAFLAVNKAEKVMAGYDYDNWFTGGHSLGGWAAEHYASKHGEGLQGVVLFAARPRDGVGVPELVLCGSEDGLVKPAETLDAGDVGENVTLEIIEGGNHAQFGSYGTQSGDGTATVSAEAQREEGARLTAEWMREHIN